MHSAVLAMVLSIRHEPVLYQKGWIDRVGFRHRGYPRLGLRCVRASSKTRRLCPQYTIWLEALGYLFTSCCCIRRNLVWQEARLIDIDWRRATQIDLLTYLLTYLVSHGSIVDGNWPPALSDVSVICRVVNPRLTSQKIWIFCTECTGQGMTLNWFERYKWKLEIT